MQILSVSDPTAIPKAIQALHAGQLIIYPTETCYGIAADCHKPIAINRLLTYKGDRDRQISIAVSDLKMAKKYVNLNSMATNLYQEFLPGPITVISNSLHHTDPRLESSTGTLGVRLPKHDFAIQLIRKFGSPITATSANTSGRKEPYSLDDWRKYTSKTKQNQVSIFLNAGKLLDRPTSTVVDTTLNDPSVLRQGELTIPNLTKKSFTSTSPAETKQFASNLIIRHLPLTKKYPLIIALSGDLGAGKTQLTQGIACTLGITDSVTSPTYTLMREYPYGQKYLRTGLPAGKAGFVNSNLNPGSKRSPRSGIVNSSKYSGVLYHIDTWRLSDLSELDSTLHLTDYLIPGNILVLEWASKAKKWLKTHQNTYPTLLINIDVLDKNTRIIKYAFSTPEWS